MHRARRALGTRAIGHTGTLDPFATGLLVLLVGRATRLARFLDGVPKTYLASARLGVATETDDATGTAAVDPAWRGADPAALAAALAGLVGSQLQRPPAYSAKHVAGERSYARARRGEAVELPPVPVTIHAVELLEVAESLVTFRVSVSAGTYVRAIARDLGARLGTSAHLVALRRERIGPLSVDAAVPLDELGSGTRVLAPQAVLGHLPVLAVDAAGAADVAHGRTLPIAGFAGMTVAVQFDDRLLAVAEGIGNAVQPRVVLAEP